MRHARTITGAGGAPPYDEGVRLLARRELSVAELRARLQARCPGDPSAVAAAVARLQAEGAVDDRRAAALCVRRAVGKHRSRARVLAELEALGIAPDIARAVVDEAVPPEDEDARIEDALRRKLRGRPPAKGAGRTLRAWLVRQGFDPDRVGPILRRHLGGDDGDNE